MKKPKILILIMSASHEHFKNQINDCRCTWLSVLDNDKYKSIIDKYTDNINWMYYDTVDDIYKLDVHNDRITAIHSVYNNKKVIRDDNDSHHLQNVLLDDKWTFQKTYDVFDWVCNDDESEFKDYDYIIRANTSTYINIITLVYYLYKEFNKDNNTDDIKWSERVYTVELIGQPGIINIPNSGDIYGRGNCLVLPLKLVKDAILPLGLLHNSDTYNGSKCEICDDDVIGNILNCHYNNFETRPPHCYDYLNYIVGLPFAWYKSVPNGYEIKHGWCKDGLASDITPNNIEMYAGACGIQIKNYIDRSVESNHYHELHAYMCKYVYDYILNDINILEHDIYDSVCEYTENPSVFILGNIPYMPLKDYIEMLKDKNKLHDLEKFVFICLPMDINHYQYKQRLYNKYNIKC